jgi:hypothetical protein
MESPNTSSKITPKRSDIDIDLGRNMNGLKRNVYYINNVTATEYLEFGQSEQRNQKGRLIELSV